MFGDAWMRSIGWEPSEEDTPGPSFYIGPLVTCFLASVAVALLAGATGASGIAEPMVWFAIMASYHLLGLVIAAVIVSVWT